MAAHTCLRTVYKSLDLSKCTLCRHLHGTHLAFGGRKWRVEHGLPEKGLDAEYGPFVDKPDWSYADGRPAPPTVGMLRRKAKNTELARKTVEYLSDLKRAKSLHEEKVRQHHGKIKEKEAARLKPKGKLLSKEKQ